MGNRHPADNGGVACADPGGVRTAAEDSRGMLEMLVWRDAAGPFPPGIYVVVRKCGRCPRPHLNSIEHDGGPFHRDAIFVALIGGPSAIDTIVSAGDA